MIANIYEPEVNPMKCLLRKPAYLIPCSQAVLNNSDHIIHREVAELLKRTNYYAIYTAQNFTGYVWWSNDLQLWACEIWQHNRHQDTLAESTLPALMWKTCSKYGYL